MNDKNVPTGSSLSRPLAKFLRCGILMLSVRWKAWSSSGFGDFGTSLILSSSGSTTMESGLGGAGISGTGSGVKDVIPRSGAGGGVIFTFLGGSGGVTEFCRSKLTLVSLLLSQVLSSFWPISAVSV